MFQAVKPRGGMGKRAKVAEQEIPMLIVKPSSLTLDLPEVREAIQYDSFPLVEWIDKLSLVQLKAMFIIRLILYFELTIFNFQYLLLLSKGALIHHRELHRRQP